MRAFSETAVYLGSWRWNVLNNRVVVGADIARAFGIDPLGARKGIGIERFAAAIVPEDKPLFTTAIDRATVFGGELSFDCRLLNGDRITHVQVVGDCVDAIDGRPVEYLGATHIREEHADQPLIAATDHLIAAAHLARADGQASLSYFIDMALLEAGNHIVKADRRRAAARPRVAISNR